MNKTASFINGLVFILNMGLVTFYLSLNRIEYHEDFDIGQYAFNNLSLQMSILSTIIAFGGICLGIVGFLGYKSIKQSALIKASAVAKEEAAKIAKEEAAKIAQNHINETEMPPKKWKPISPYINLDANKSNQTSDKEDGQGV